MLLLCTEIPFYMNFWQYKSKLQMHLPQWYQLIILIAYQMPYIVWEKTQTFIVLLSIKSPLKYMKNKFHMLQKKL